MNSLSASANIKLTRYLYIKDEVELSLVSAILERSDHALFWCYELYHSGYINDLIHLLWKIYFDFFAVLNPSFEKYLITKCKVLHNQNTSNDIGIDTLKQICDEKMVGNIVENLLIRPHNLDVFVLREMACQFDFDFNNELIEKYKTSKNISIISNILTELLNEEDYLMLSNLFINVIDVADLTNIFGDLIEYYKLIGIQFKSNNEKMLNDFSNLIKIHDARLVLLSKLIHFESLKKNKKMGKNIFIQIEYNQIKKYETVEAILFSRERPAYKILKQSNLLRVDEYNYLSLFSLQRSNYDFKNIWYYDWVYYASFSPLWLKRIKQHNGIISHSSQKVIFINEDDEECFVEYYNLEPDEQTKEIQNLLIGPILKERSWKDLIKKYSEFSILNIDEELLNDLSIVVY
jgi:hypothetical protein